MQKLHRVFPDINVRGIPVVVTNRATTEYLSNADAVGVTDFCDNFGQGTGIPWVCLNAESLLDSEDVLKNVESTVLHEFGHCIYRQRSVADRNEWRNTYAKLQEDAMDMDKFFFWHGSEEAFAELFQWVVLDGLNMSSPQFQMACRRAVDRVVAPPDMACAMSRSR